MTATPPRHTMMVTGDRLLDYGLTKRLSEQFDITLDWRRFIRSGDAIASVAWSYPAGFTQDVAFPDSFTDTTATTWLIGGHVSTSIITCQITTSAGRTLLALLEVQVVEDDDAES